LYNGGVGFATSGTQNDTAVWRISMTAYGNWAGGVNIADTFHARAWLAHITSEASSNDGSSPCVYIGLGERSMFYVYAEDSTVGVNDIEIASVCSHCYVFDYRLNKTVNNSTSTVTGTMAEHRLFGDVVYEPKITAPSVTVLDTDYIQKTWQIASLVQPVKRRIHVDGIEHRVLTGSYSVSRRLANARAYDTFANASGQARIDYIGARGSIDELTAAEADDVVYLQNIRAQSGSVDSFIGARILGVLEDTAAPVNKGSIALYIATTPVGSTTPR
jgi:hypothetical protein